jgi:hypothetical protein
MLPFIFQLFNQLFGYVCLGFDGRREICVRLLLDHMGEISDGRTKSGWGRNFGNCVLIT